MSKRTFKTFILEEGVSFGNVIDDTKETVFGHTADSYTAGKLPDKRTKKQKLQDKLIAYIQWASAVNR